MKKAVQNVQTELRELGEVAIDSGNLVLIDPAYLREVNGTKLYSDIVQDHMSGSTFDNNVNSDVNGIVNGAKILGCTWLKRHLGVLLPNFGGDGVYPVIGKFEDKQLVGVYIDFEDNRWEAFKTERISEEEFIDREDAKRLYTKQSPYLKITPVSGGLLFVGLSVRGQMIAAHKGATDQQVKQYQDAISMAETDVAAAEAFGRIHPSFTPEELRKRCEALPKPRPTVFYNNGNLALALSNILDGTGPIEVRPFVRDEATSQQDFTETLRVNKALVNMLGDEVDKIIARYQTEAA
jgi:hypothetical protein